MVIELIKIINQLDENNEILIYDIIHGFQTISIPSKNPYCLVCNENKIINEYNFHNLDIYNNYCNIDNKYSISFVKNINNFITIDILYTDNINDKVDELMKLDEK